MYIKKQVWVPLVVLLGLATIVCVVVLACTPSGPHSRRRYADTPSRLPVCSGQNRSCAFGDTPWRATVPISPSPPASSHAMLAKLRALPFDNFSEDCPKRQDATLRILKLKSVEDIRDMNHSVLREVDPDTPRTSGVVYLDTASLHALVGDAGLDRLQRLLGDLGKFHLLKLWINTRGYATPLHADNVRNVVLQLAGSKRWVIASRRYERQCYFDRKNSANNTFYKVANPYAPDLAAHPAFAKVKTLDLDMEAGDVLYLPQNYLHFVHSNNCSVMLSFIF